MTSLHWTPSFIKDSFSSKTTRATSRIFLSTSPSPTMVRASSLANRSSFDSDPYPGRLADFGVSKTIDLIPGGSEIPVTNENRIRYIALMSNYRLNAQLVRSASTL